MNAIQEALWGIVCAVEACTYIEYSINFNRFFHLFPLNFPLFSLKMKRILHFHCLRWLVSTRGRTHIHTQPHQRHYNRNGVLTKWSIITFSSYVPIALYRHTVFHAAKPATRLVASPVTKWNGIAFSEH